MHFPSSCLSVLDCDQTEETIEPTTRKATMKRIRGGHRGRPKRFIDSLYSLLHRAAPDKLLHVVTWQADGGSFLIKQPKLLTKLLPKYGMNVKVFHSFQRQLNIYGFTRTKTRVRSAIEYHHPSFHRDDPASLSKIERVGLPSKKSNEGSTAAGAPESSPKEQVPVLLSREDSPTRLHSCATNTRPTPRGKVETTFPQSGAERLDFPLAATAEPFHRNDIMCTAHTADITPDIEPLSHLLEEAPSPYQDDKLTLPSGYPPSYTPLPHTTHAIPLDERLAASPAIHRSKEDTPVEAHPPPGRTHIRFVNQCPLVKPRMFCPANHRIIGLPQRVTTRSVSYKSHNIGSQAQEAAIGSQTQIQNLFLESDWSDQHVPVEFFDPFR